VIEGREMSLHEIVLPDTKPETEWVRGRALQKVSPQRDHGRLQNKFGSALDAWAGCRGEVATEWRFRVAPPGELRRPLVPDVAFVSIESLRGKSRAEIQIPAFAPTVAVEILSPDDRQDDVDSKIDVYLRAGTELVIVVDSRSQTIGLHDAERTSTLTRGDTLSHAALPGFSLDISAYFDDALRLIEE
jgi:Uma2 family endonuclease